MKEDKMGEASNMRGRDGKCLHRLILVRELYYWRPHGRLKSRKKHDMRVWTELLWLRIGSSGDITRRN
jgi:hypothetical protein